MAIDCVQFVQIYIPLFIIIGMIWGLKKIKDSLK